MCIDLEFISLSSLDPECGCTFESGQREKSQEAENGTNSSGTIPRMYHRLQIR